MKNYIKDVIVIKDWTGRPLFKGHYKSKDVDRVLDANRCDCESGCKQCDDSGYSGDFQVFWLDESDERNIYEFINY